jgi:hypothetical protein
MSENMFSKAGKFVCRLMKSKPGESPRNQHKKAKCDEKNNNSSSNFEGVNPYFKLVFQTQVSCRKGKPLELEKLTL